MERKNNGSAVLREVADQVLATNEIYANAYFNALENPSMILSVAERKLLRKVGETLRTLRMAAGLDLGAASKEADINEPSLFFLESGLPGGENVTIGEIHRLSALIDQQMKGEQIDQDPKGSKVYDLLHEAVTEPPHDALLSVPIGHMVRWWSNRDKLHRVVQRAGRG